VLRAFSSNPPGVELIPPFWTPRRVDPAGIPAGGGPAEPWDLAAGLAQVWLVRADRPVAGWSGILTAEEFDRLARFRREADARREAAGRGALRLLLGGYLGVDPALLAIAAGPFGKPEAPAAGSGGVRFNLAHSGDWVLLAFVRGFEVGVDLEQWREIGAEEVARRAFADEEFAAWRRRPEAQRAGAFFDLWTAKEAYLKALGRGLGKDPRSFEVRIGSGGDAELVWCADDPEAPRRWRLQSLAVGPGYSAAIAVDRSIGRVRTHTLQMDASARGRPAEGGVAPTNPGP
jgi:4'-phosphopantetheinyl transferase